MQKPKSNMYALDLYKLYAGGLLVGILVLIQGFLSMTNFDLLTIISMSAAAIAIPPLSSILVIHFVTAKYPYMHSLSASTMGIHIALVLGMLAGLVAVDTAFWHVSLFAGVAFIVALALTATICVWYVSHLKEEP